MDEYANKGNASNIDPVRTYAKQPLARLNLAMEEKLRVNAYKGTWEGATLEYLSDRLAQEMHELKCAVALDEGSPAIWREAADVALFAMMIADNATRKSLRKQIEEVILSSKYGATLGSREVARIIAEGLANANLTVAYDYTLDDVGIQVPVMVFDLTQAPKMCGTAVVPYMAGTNEAILAEVGEVARSGMVDAIICPTPLFRIHKVLPQEAFGKPVRALYMGGQVE